MRRWKPLLAIVALASSADVCPLPDGWRPATALGGEYLTVTAFDAQPACDFPAAISDDALPAVLLGVSTNEQRSEYAASELLTRHGTLEMVVGLMEEPATLESVLAQMRYETPANASMAWSRRGSSSLGASDIWAQLPMAPLLANTPTNRLLAIGSDGAGLPLHRDGATLSSLLHGHVLWVVAPPGALLPSPLLAAHGHALLEELGRLRARPYDDAKRHLLTCTQAPGSAVYLPAGWARAAVHLGDAVALTVQQADWHEPPPREPAVEDEIS